MIRHDLQHRGTGPGEVEASVHPLTAELMSFAPRGHTKAVAKMTAAEIEAAFDAAENVASAPAKLPRARC